MVIVIFDMTVIQKIMTWSQLWFDEGNYIKLHQTVPKRFY